MQCDQTREILLELGWDAETRLRSAEALTHLQTCAECQKAAADFDRLHVLLEPPETTPPTGGWAAFERRSIPSVVARRQWIPWASAIAAMLVVGTICLEIGRRHPSSNPTVAGVLPPSAAPLTTTDIATAVKTFERVSEVFDRRASWVMLSDGASDVGMGPSVTSADQPVLLLRMTLLRDDVVSHGHPSILTKSDLVIIPGQPADLTIPLRDGQSFHYHISTSVQTPTRLGISAELHGSDQELIAALATRLTLAEDANLTAGKLASNAGEYRLQVAFARSVLPRGGQ